MNVIMIAHEGVTQPMIWEKWIEQSRLDNIRINLYVIAPLNPKYGETFCNNNRLYKPRSRNPVYLGNTSWGSFSIVFETIKAILYVVNLDRNLERIFIVSGYDIPIKSLSEWKSVNHDYNIIGKRKYRDIIFHSQWITLNRQTTYNIARMFHPSILKQTFVELFINTNKRQSERLAPDELWLFVLGLNPDDFIDGDMTHVVFQTPVDSSPIIWNSLNRSRKIIYTDKIINTTLQSVIEKSKQSSTCLFFRKISPNVNIPISLLFNPEQQVPQLQSQQQEEEIPTLQPLDQRQITNIRNAHLLVNIYNSKTNVSSKDWYQLFNKYNFVQKDILNYLLG